MLVRLDVFHYLVLNGRGAIPGGRQFGLAVGETRVYEEPVALGTGEASHRCHHLLPEICICEQKLLTPDSGVVQILTSLKGVLCFAYNASRAMALVLVIQSVRFQVTS